MLVVVVVVTRRRGSGEVIDWLRGSNFVASSSLAASLRPPALLARCSLFGVCWTIRSAASLWLEAASSPRKATLANCLPTAPFFASTLENSTLETGEEPEQPSSRQHRPTRERRERGAETTHYDTTRRRRRLDCDGRAKATLRDQRPFATILPSSSPPFLPSPSRLRRCALCVCNGVNSGTNKAAIQRAASYPPPPAALRLAPPPTLPPFDITASPALSTTSSSPPRARHATLVSRGRAQAIYYRTPTSTRRPSNLGPLGTTDLCLRSPSFPLLVPLLSFFPPTVATRRSINATNGSQIPASRAAHLHTNATTRVASI